VLTLRDCKLQGSQRKLAAAMLYGPALWVNSFIHKHEHEPIPTNGDAKATEGAQGNMSSRDKTAWHKLAKSCFTGSVMQERV
jgi:hypothetical protein